MGGAVRRPVHAVDRQRRKPVLGGGPPARLSLSCTDHHQRLLSEVRQCLRLPEHGGQFPPFVTLAAQLPGSGGEALFLGPGVARQPREAASEGEPAETQSSQGGKQCGGATVGVVDPRVVGQRELPGAGGVQQDQSRGCPAAFWPVAVQTTETPRRVSARYGYGRSTGCLVSTGPSLRRGAGTRDSTSGNCRPVSVALSAGIGVGLNPFTMR